MRAITVRQPWAWATIHGGKDVENRGRNIAGSYRGPIAIHAGKSVDDLEDIYDPRVAEELNRAATVDRPTVGDHMTFGAIIGLVDLVGVHESDRCWAAGYGRVRDMYLNNRAAFDALPDSGAGGVAGKVRPCSPWAMVNQFHLVLANPRPLPEPIPCRGALGLWTVPRAAEERIRLGGGERS